jgi:hypothetical protein
LSQNLKKRLKKRRLLRAFEKSKEEWLALEDDFRTPGIGPIVAGLPQFDLTMHSQLADSAHRKASSGF